MIIFSVLCSIHSDLPSTKHSYHWTRHRDMVLAILAFIFPELCNLLLLVIKDKEFKFWYWIKVSLFLSEKLIAYFRWFNIFFKTHLCIWKKLRRDTWNNLGPESPALCRQVLAPMHCLSMMYIWKNRGAVKATLKTFRHLFQTFSTSKIFSFPIKNSSQVYLYLTRIRNANIISETKRTSS